MPIYEYDCPICGRFEFLQKVSDKPLSHCPACKENDKKSKVTKAVSITSFQLVGSGWYKTDYANGAGNSAGAKKADSDVGGKAVEKSAEKSGTDSTGSDAKPSGKCGSGCGCG